MFCIRLCRAILWGLSFMWLSACSTVKVTDYQANAPALSLPTFFDGELTAHGVVKNRWGKVERYFNATITASWNDGVGTLDEHFIFDDGEKQRRVWTLKPNDQGQYIGTAGDVIGEGIARVAGNAVFLKYVLQIDYKGSKLNLTVDDRMYLVNDNTLINESRLTKWGFDVGEIVLVISKVDS